METLMQDLLVCTPMIVLTAGALLIMMLEVFITKPWPRGPVAAWTLVASIGTTAAYAHLYQPGRTVFSELMYADMFSCFFSIIILGGALVTLLMSMRKVEEEGIESPGEFYALQLIATAGAILFVSSAELITLFLGLEIMSMALYCLCGSALGIRSSSESALKYFLLGSFSSAFLLYGIALIYGLSGSMEIADIADMAREVDSATLLVAMGLLLVGITFKIGVVPFHFWAPDVYQGAPTSVTAYMACVIKAAAVGAAMRILWTGFGDMLPFWAGAVWIMAVLTMVVGNAVALRQRSVKRMLAYSSIAHAGYILVGFLAPDETFGGGAAILFYLVGYTVMTLGAFGVVLVVSAPYAKEVHPCDISRFYGLGTRRPFLGALMSLFMLSLAGIPPGMVGLLGKFYIFSAAVKADYIGISVIAMLCSTVSCYYYLRVIVAMYFMDAKDSSVASEPGPLSVSCAGALGFCAACVVLFGLFPSYLYDGAAAIMASFH